MILRSVPVGIVASGVEVYCTTKECFQIFVCIVTAEDNVLTKHILSIIQRTCRPK